MTEVKTRFVCGSAVQMAQLLDGSGARACCADASLCVSSMSVSLGVRWVSVPAGCDHGGDPLVSPAIDCPIGTSRSCWLNALWGSRRTDLSAFHLRLSGYRGANTDLDRSALPCSSRRTPTSPDHEPRSPGRSFPRPQEPTVACCSGQRQGK